LVDPHDEILENCLRGKLVMSQLLQEEEKEEEIALLRAW
jgi:hypothetical protein